MLILSTVGTVAAAGALQQNSLSPPHSRLQSVGRQHKGGSVGLCGAVMHTALGAPSLGNLPDAVSCTYSIADQRLLPTHNEATLENVANDKSLTWAVTAKGGFTASPLNGTTPTSFWIRPTSFGTGTAAAYTGAVTVAVTGSEDAEGLPHRIYLPLQVSHTPLVSVHLPLVLRDHTSLPARWPNDPDFGFQWALTAVKAPRAWSLSTGPDVLIAILDTGVDLDHPDLAAKLRTDIDRDFVSDDEDADDDHGHGTHVAGIAAAATDNELGIAGLGWDAAILSLKVLEADGYGSEADLAAAIRYAADKGAAVVNISLGGAYTCPRIVQEAANYAYAKDAVLVAAAGNHGDANGLNAELFPANCEHVLGVAATNRDGSTAPYSNYGSHVDVAAPGSGIYSTLVGGGYGYKDGTSMATPHVAGLAALLRARYPSYTPDQITSAILDNAQDLGPAGWDSSYGCGCIDAFRALYEGAHGSQPACLEGVKACAVGVGETPSGAPFVPGEILVALRPGVRMTSVSLRHGAGAKFLPALAVWVLRVPPGQERATLARLRADGDVVHADLNYLVFAQ